MTDLLPPEVAKWQFIEEKTRAVLDAFAYREVRADAPRAYLAHRRWQHEPVTKWYELRDRTVTASFFGPTAPSADAELVAMAALVAIEAGVRIEALTLELAGPPLERLHEIAIVPIAGDRTRFSLRAAGRSIAQGARQDDLVSGEIHVPFLSLTIDIAAVVEAVPDPVAAFEPPLAAFIAAEGPHARRWALFTAQSLRVAGIRTDLAHDQSPLGVQIARAQALGARVAVIVDDARLAAARILIQDFGTGQSHEVSPLDVEAAVRPLLD